MTEQHRPWTSGEIAELRRLAPLGPAGAAEALGRSIGSVKMQASRHRISLRRTGERRGCVLGERKPGTLPREERTLILLGVTDAERADKRARLDGIAPLCPSCGHRPQERRSGLCEVCDVRRLTDAHRWDRKVVIVRRELDAARQAKHRARS